MCQGVAAARSVRPIQTSGFKQNTEDQAEGKFVGYVLTEAGGAVSLWSCPDTATDSQGGLQRKLCQSSRRLHVGANRTLTLFTL